MDLKPAARAVFRRIGVPLFTSDEVADMTGIKSTTLRAWISRGHVRLLGAERPGRGRTMMLSATDLITVLAFSQIARLSIPPTAVAQEVVDLVTANVSQHVRLIAGIEDEDDEEQPIRRYLVAYYFDVVPGLRKPMADFVGLKTMEVDNLDSIASELNDSTFVAIDCKDFAEKLLYYVTPYKARFTKAQ